MDALPVALGCIAIIIFLFGVASLINLSQNQKQRGETSAV